MIRDSVRSRLAEALSGIIGQRLVQRRGARSRVLCTEIMINHPIVRDCIRDPARLRGLTAALEAGSHEFSTHSFDQTLVLVKDGLVSQETAQAVAINPGDLVRILQERALAFGTPWSRCLTCKGAQGAYGSGSHKTGFAGIATTKSVAEIIDSLKVKHGYGAVGLNDVDLQDLAAFVKEGQIDTAPIIGATKKFIGDPAKGMMTFSSACVVCHGANGLNTTIPGFMGMFDEFPGKIANENPWEFQHKVRFGQPGSAMPPQMRNLTVAQVGELGAYVQTLPAAP